LPFGCHGLGLWKLGDVVAGGLQRHKLAPAGQWYRIVESLFPAFGHQANNSAPTYVNFSRITGQMTAFNLFSEFFLEFGDLVSVSLPNAHDLIGSILRDRISLVDEPFHETTMLFHSICRMTFQPSNLFKDLPSRFAQNVSLDRLRNGALLLDTIQLAVSFAFGARYFTSQPSAAAALNVRQA
jgi:hypothetical protein